MTAAVEMQGFVTLGKCSTERRAHAEQIEVFELASSTSTRVGPLGPVSVRGDRPDAGDRLEGPRTLRVILELGLRQSSRHEG